MPQYDDSQRSRNRLSSEKVHKNPDKPKDGGMPQYDNSERSRDRMSSEKVCKRETTNPRTGVCPSRRVLKWVCSSMTTRKDQEIDRAMMRSVKKN